VAGGWEQRDGDAHRVASGTRRGEDRRESN
jgi:hypothetical protein